MAAFRYGTWHGGPDPLEPPYDLRDAVDALGEDVLAGSSPRQALDRLLSRGQDGRAGLAELRRRARERARELRNSGRLDGTLQQVRELLDRAVELERQALFPDPSDLARLAEAELDQLPADTARAVRELADRRWRSPQAQQTYEQIHQLLRSEVLDAQFQGLRSALQNPDEADLERMRQMLAALNDMLDADARGEHTPEQFEQFIDSYGDFFPEDPQDLAELIDAMARRAAAAQQLMNSLSPDQRAELADLMQQAMAGSGLGAELGRLQDGLRSARPDLPWDGRQSMDGSDGLGYSDATSALAELADLDALSEQLGQDYPGASLADVDEELVARALGSQAAEDLQQLRRTERQLQDQGFLRRGADGLTLTPRAMRRLGATALRRVFASAASRVRGGHDVRDAGAAGETTGASRQWQFGDEQPLEVVRTVRNAVLRSAGGPLALAPEDFEVVETERRSRAAVALLVDMSYSMWLGGIWREAATTALALHSLVTTQYPQDAIEIIGFSDVARVLSPADIVNHSWTETKGTNLQHALRLARRHLDRHRGAESVILVITDGEPTAHTTPEGWVDFYWPTTPETVAATMAEVDLCTRGGATINVFMVDDVPGLVAFMHRLAERNGGRVFQPNSGTLGRYVVADYLRSRRGGRRGRAAS